MRIYHYDSETGEYLGSSDARPDPLETGRFLIPACATDVEPPKNGANETAVFAGDAWSVMPDFRGTDYWLSHNEKHTIESIGETVPEGAFLDQPEPSPPTPEQLATKARADRDAKLTATNWLVERHREEQETGATTLSAQEYADLLAYRQALRDVPQQSGFPESIQWPELHA